MFKRLFFAMVGLGAGVALGVMAVRKIDQTTRRLAPDQLAASASARAGSWRATLEQAIAEGRAAAAAKEAELRERVRRPPVEPPVKPTPPISSEPPTPRSTP
ncbi:MAG TPA: hypothetical protein VIK95_15325 [Egibacteraceae bacterium]